MPDTAYTYPADDLDNRAELRALLGSFWDTVYEQGSLVGDLAAARGRLERQTNNNIEEMADCQCRYRVPVFHRDQWRQMLVRQSEMVGVEPVFPVPADLRDIPIICNRITSPSVTYLAGLDFVLDADASTITFRSNPFDDANIPTHDIYSGGVITDKGIALWLCNSQSDKRNVYSHLGYVLNTSLPSSESYKALLNAAMDAEMRGTSAIDVRNLVSAITDVPLVKSETETVEVIIRQADALLVCTDAAVYRFHPDAVPVVAAGDTVHLGDTLTDSLEFYDFNRGQVPTADRLPAVTLYRSMLAGHYAHDLVFANGEQPITTGFKNDDVYTTFPVGGWAADVATFWDELHRRCLAAGTSVADLLNTKYRTKINPAAFLVANVLRNNASGIRIRVGLLGEHALPLDSLRFIRALLPPHQAALLFLDLASGSSELASETFSSLCSTTVGQVNAPIAFYIEFENGSGQEVTPPATTSTGRSYYDDLLMHPVRDYLRVPVTASTLSDGVLTLVSQTAGTAGEAGRKPFDSARRSRIYGGALVAVADINDPTRDVVIDRWYLDAADQIVKPAGNVQITISRQFTAS